MQRNKLVGCDLLRWHNTLCAKREARAGTIEIIRNIAVLMVMFVVTLFVERLLP